MESTKIRNILKKILFDERADSQLISHRARLLASILVLFSIVPLFFHTFFPDVDEEYFGFISKRMFYNYLGMVLSPLLCYVGLAFKAYLSSLVPVLFVYITDFIWIFSPKYNESYMFWVRVYAFVVVVSLCLIYRVLREVSFIQDQNHVRAKAEIDKIEEKRIAIENDSKKLEEMIEKLESQA